MTVKEAAKLKKGDRVWLTRDERTWVVSFVHKLGPRDVEVLICTKGEVDGLRLRGAAALRSIKRAKEKTRGPR